MLTSRTPMKRTGFKRAGTSAGSDFHTQREQRLAERAARAIACASPSPDNVEMVAANDLEYMSAAPVEKENPLRSEPYRRLVAALPCAYCRIEGYSQHAHENEGKGARMKVDDRRGMPLCCTRPDIEGCHVAFDQYRLLPGGREAHHAQGSAWAAQTRAQIKESGRWPKKLPEWREGGSDAI